jgi:catechol 2,3-dioxygenase-like lactoylglutathione lyase family enzyme
MRHPVLDSFALLRSPSPNETMAGMINGAHIVLYTRDPETDRAFFRDVLQLPSVDAGHGWLIFALPPAEAAFHGVEKPALDKNEESNDRHELYFMCDDLAATLSDLKQKNVPVSSVSEQRWGSLASVTLPGGGKVGIYQPKHPRPRQS